ncbi:MAG: hypothetical protein ACOC9T_02830, partial [Myxococcota bacterium]
AQGRRMPLSVLGTPPESLLYRRLASYRPQVQRYLDVFGADRVHVLLLEDLRSAPEAAFEKVLRFLDVDPRFRPEFRARNRGFERTARWPRLRRLLRNRATVAALRAILRNSGSNAPPQWLRAFNRAMYARQEVPKLAPARKRELERKYLDARELDALADLLGRDLSAWK